MGQEMGTATDATPAWAVHPILNSSMILAWNTSALLSCLSHLPTELSTHLLLFTLSIITLPTHLPTLLPLHIQQCQLSLCSSAPQHKLIVWYEHNLPNEHKMGVWIVYGSYKLDNLILYHSCSLMWSMSSLNRTIILTLCVYCQQLVQDMTNLNQWHLLKIKHL